jgi:hypothetical protein
MSRERFVETVIAGLRDAPAYFTYDAVLNARERPTLEAAHLKGSKRRPGRKLRHLLVGGLEAWASRS